MFAELYSDLKRRGMSWKKNSKEKLIILLCTNSDGNDKRMLIEIGKPRCFINIKNLPVLYHANSKAWMINKIFSEFLNDFDKSVGKQKRKVVLSIDNCSVHPPNISSLEIWKFIFIPLIALCYPVLFSGETV